MSELPLPHRNDLDQTFQYNSYLCICTKHDSENQTGHDVQEHNISSLDSLLYNWYLYQNNWITNNSISKNVLINLEKCV